MSRRVQKSVAKRAEYEELKRECRYYTIRGTFPSKTCNYKPSQLRVFIEQAKEQELVRAAQRELAENNTPAALVNDLLVIIASYTDFDTTIRIATLKYELTNVYLYPNNSILWRHKSLVETTFDYRNKIAVGTHNYRELYRQRDHHISGSHLGLYASSNKGSYDLRSLYDVSLGIRYVSGKYPGEIYYITTDGKSYSGSTTYTNSSNTTGISGQLLILTNNLTASICLSERGTIFRSPLLTMGLSERWTNIATAQPVVDLYADAVNTYAVSRDGSVINIETPNGNVITPDIYYSNIAKLERAVMGDGIQIKRVFPRIELYYPQYIFVVYDQ